MGDSIYNAEGGFSLTVSICFKFLSVFISVPTSETIGGDSNPTAILTNYSGNHSVSFSDATYLRE